MGRIIIVDVGTGNLRSVRQAVLHADPECGAQISDSPDRIDSADRLILPGQGAIGSWMDRLQDRPFADALERSIRSKPILGICVGMQAMYTRSTENEGTEGLSIVAGEVRRFEEMTTGGERLKVPHMGWNRVRQRKAHPLWQGIDDHAWFYLVHSYYAPLGKYTTGSCEYGKEFTAAVAWRNIFAVQFHPEKSQHAGLKMYRNFLQWQPQKYIVDVAQPQPILE